MTENEVIRELEWAKNRLMQSSHMDNNRMKAFNMAIQALEKQVPKKPLLVPMDDTCLYHEKHCPNCESLLVARYKHCPKCGQKLDWSEE